MCPADVLADSLAHESHRVRGLTSTASFMVAEAPPVTTTPLDDVVTCGVRPRRTSARSSYDTLLIYDPAWEVRLGPGRHRTFAPVGH